MASQEMYNAPMGDGSGETEEERAFAEALKDPDKGPELVRQILKEQYGIDANVAYGAGETQVTPAPQAPAPPVEGATDDEIVLYRKNVEAIAKQAAEDALNKERQRSSAIEVGARGFSDKVDKALEPYKGNPNFEAVAAEFNRRLVEVPSERRATASEADIQQAFEKVAGEVMFRQSVPPSAGGGAPQSVAPAMLGASKIPGAEGSKHEALREHYYRNGMTPEEVDKLVKEELNG